MSRKERVLASLLLAIAIAGGALIPRLLASPTNPLGIALGPRPGRSVVQAPAISPAPRHQAPAGRTSSTTQPSSGSVARVSGPTTPVSNSSPVSHNPAPPTGPEPNPNPPSPVPTPSPTPSPSPAPLQPPVAIHSPAAVTPFVPPGHGGTPPGQGGTPPGHETPPGHGGTPPGRAVKVGAGASSHASPEPTKSPAKSEAKPGRRKGTDDLSGSGRGRPVSQAPSHAVGPRHRRVRHLAPSAKAAAPAAHKARPKARPKDRGTRGKGGHGSTQAPVTPGHGNSSTSGNGNDKAQDTADQGAGDQQSADQHGNGKANGHKG